MLLDSAVRQLYRLRSVLCAVKAAGDYYLTAYRVFEADAAAQLLVIGS